MKPIKIANTIHRERMQSLNILLDLLLLIRMMVFPITLKSKLSRECQVNTLIRSAFTICPVINQVDLVGII